MSLLALLVAPTFAQPAQAPPGNLAFCSTALIPPGDFTRCLYDLAWVDNYPTCSNTLPLVPCDGEEAHWSATAVGVPAGFTVTHIRYGLDNGLQTNGVDCDATLPHKAALLVTDSLPLNPNPRIIEEFSMAGSATPSQVTLEAALSVPYVVAPGEFLYVAVQYAGDVDPDAADCAEGGPVICQTTCTDLNANRDAWWSNRSTEPFAWVNLTTFGILAAPIVGVRGY